jgi:hypothetical protein
MTEISVMKVFKLSKSARSAVPYLLIYELNN